MVDHLKVVFNRPALAALSARSGTYGEFFQQLVDGLSDRQRPALARLTTRDPADFTLALLDAWACVADVVTFYQERLADECYLGTSRELLSVRELARAIGYAPGPGLAAAALLAVSVDDAPGAPATVRVDPGLKVMSVPGPGETSQTFETLETLELRPEFNAVPAVTTTAVHDFRSELRISGHPGLDVGAPLILLDDNAEDSGRCPGLRVALLDEVTRDGPDTRVAWSGFGFHPRTGTVKAVRLRQHARVVPRIKDETTQSKQRLEFSSVPTLGGQPGSLSRLLVLTDGVHTELYPHAGIEIDVTIDTAGRRPLGSFNPATLVAHFDAESLALPPTPLTVADDLHLQGPPPALAEGDTLLVRDRAGERWAVAVAGTVRRDVARQTLVVTPRWAAGTGALLVPGDDLVVSVLRQRAPLFGHNAPDPQQVALNYTTGITRVKGTPFEFIVEVNGVKFPHTIQPFTSITWDRLTAKDQEIDLAFLAPQLQPGSGLVLVHGSRVERYLAADAQAVQIQEYTFNGPATRVIPRSVGLRPPNNFLLAGTEAVYGSDPVRLATVPLPALVTGSELELAGDLTALPLGRTLIVTGESEAGDPIAEAVRLVERTPLITTTRIRVSPALALTYRRASLRVRGNAVRASHGETTEEILGNGDASQVFQRFFLGHSPLTFVSAANAVGRRAALELRVAGLLWREVDDLEGQSPTDRVYLLQADPGGRTYVQFGDGVHGARLPTGVANVRVTYRKGLGLAGQVRPNTLTLPLTAPAGVRNITNPLAAAGAADPELAADARKNATRSVIALGRVVSLRDYEDFARAFAGIAKAQAVQVAQGRVALTVTGPRGAQVLPGSDLFKNLAQALRAAGDPTVAFSLHTFDPVGFVLEGTIRPAPEFIPADVHAAVSAALLARFSFDAREFAAPVYFSEIVAAIQSVPGVVSVDLDRLARAGAEDVKEPPPILLGARAFDPKTGARTELLTLDPTCLVDLKVIP